LIRYPLFFIGCHPYWFSIEKQKAIMSTHSHGDSGE
jgi:hypothetical protein